MNNKTSKDSIKSQKIYGKPLQNLYKKLLDSKNTPGQPKIIREIARALSGQGIEYHPRTIKRQLLGKIEYIPEVVEVEFLKWLGQQPALNSEKWIKSYEAEKNKLEESSDQSLYVQPEFFFKMVESYLFLNKTLSRRQLALKLQQGLKSNNVSMGLETLQAILSGKTHKVRKIVQDQLAIFYAEAGYDSHKKIEEILLKTEKQGKQEINKVEIGQIKDLLELYLLHSEKTSKRQLALEIQNRLRTKGYDYHLSSIQSVLEGKTKKTKKAILETIHEICAEAGISEEKNPKKLLTALPESQRHWHEYIDASKVPEIVERILSVHPELTRRQLAIILQNQLKEKKFDFSLNTLQYVLSGKTQRTRKIVLEILQSDLQNDHLKAAQNKTEGDFPVKKGRPSVDRRLIEAYAKLNQANEIDKSALHDSYLEVRKEYIKKRWSQKFHHQARPKPNTKRVQPEIWNSSENMEDSSYEYEDAEDFSKDFRIKAS